ncbi:unnamed protein product [Cylindrotheca closterium]|uniref:Uncharacterized protein n=1 Tax=Cylindrotheca closterium TaxID=2856 RepID=A0AAD2G3Z7_9STRA|nr:unnamed protein product [Cylindrotheca closterium]
MNHHDDSSAIELNDCGLSSLLHHNYEEATCLFRDALYMIKQDIAHQHQQLPHMEEQAGNLQDESIVDLEFYEPCDFKDHMICKTAISIKRAAMMGSHKITSVVIYNLAITTHLWALQNGSIEKLKKALHLYKISSQTQGVHESSVAMSILNNTASIHFILGNRKEAIEILRQLWAVMTYCGKPESTSKNHYEKSWQVCQRNVVTLLMAPPSTACAA